jgi:hypothetical protein
MRVGASGGEGGGEDDEASVQIHKAAMLLSKAAAALLRWMGVLGELGLGDIGSGGSSSSHNRFIAFPGVPMCVITCHSLGGPILGNSNNVLVLLWFFIFFARCFRYQLLFS